MDYYRRSFASRRVQKCVLNILGGRFFHSIFSFICLSYGKLYEYNRFYASLKDFLLIVH